MPKAKQSETTAKKQPKVKLVQNRVVYLGHYEYEEFDIMIQSVGNVFQCVLHDNIEHQWYQQYVEDDSHDFKFNYLKDKEQLKKAAGRMFEEAVGQCNTIRNFKQYQLKAKEQEQVIKKKMKVAKHIKLDIDKMPVLKPLEAEA